MAYSWRAFARSTGSYASLATALVLAIPSPEASAQVISESGDNATYTGVADIVVTAQRREENLQDVPISVSAISSDMLARTGINGTQGIGQVVPSVQLTQSGPSAIFFVRGVGNSSGNVGEEGANAIYVDGVYLGDLTSAATKFNNVGRVEVLKGPQGTLFGRNSSGGLINIITKDPGNESEVRGLVGYGNYDTLQGQLYAATPISDTLSFDVALTGKDQNNGWGRNLATGGDAQKGWYWGARSKLAYRPTSDTKVIVAGDYYKDNNDYQNNFNLFKGSVGVGGYTYPGDYIANSTDPAYADIKSWGLSLNVEHDFDFATLTSITARRSVKVQSEFDGDYTPLNLAHINVPSQVKTFQQELRLASSSATPFNWQVGLFYYNAVAKVNGFSVTTPVRKTAITNRMETHSYAAFGELGYDITPTTHVIAGIRYTKDKRELAGSIKITGDISAIITPPEQSITTNKPTFRIALKQDLTDDINVYASYNRGFKSAIYAATGSPSDPAVKPQTIDAFEVGLKSKLFDNLVRFNLAGFHYKIDDYQVRASPGPGLTQLMNAATVKVDGVEGELAIAPAKGLQINVIATYLDSRFSSFPNALFNYQLPATCPAGLVGTANPGQVGVGPRTGGGINCIGDASGKRTPMSPKFASSIGANYRTAVGGDAELILNALWSYSSKIYFEADNRLQQPAYSVVNTSIELRPSPNWGVELWVSNLFDKHYYYTGVTGLTADQGVMAAPRTYGVNLKFDF